jgi:hypothetical protein
MVKQFYITMKISLLSWILWKNPRDYWILEESWHHMSDSAPHSRVAQGWEPFSFNFFFYFRFLFSLVLSGDFYLFTFLGFHAMVFWITSQELSFTFGHLYSMLKRTMVFSITSQEVSCSHWCLRTLSALFFPL